jgi:DNA-binding MarR family transcriptional regulator
VDTALAVPDLESRVALDHHQALKLWLRMLSCTTRIESVIRHRLRTDFATTLPRFDLLAQLEREPAGLSMGALSKRMMVSGGNITGITDLLVAEGLVTRSAHPSDRRAYTVRLTPAGRRLFRRMAAVHEQWVVELFDGWTAPQKSRAYALMAGLKQHVATVELKSPPKKSKEKST